VVLNAVNSTPLLSGCTELCTTICTPAIFFNRFANFQFWNNLPLQIQKLIEPLLAGKIAVRMRSFLESMGVFEQYPAGYYRGNG
jgi:hypothetical protein